MSGNGANTNTPASPDAGQSGERDLLQTLARIGFTIILLGIVVWWLYLVGSHLLTEPKKDANGAITADPFQRAKDILLIVLPIVTTALGYWFGAQGKEKAEQVAERASGQAQEAQEKLTAVVGASSDSDLLKRAKELYPDAFDLWRKPKAGSK